MSCAVLGWVAPSQQVHALSVSDNSFACMCDKYRKVPSACGTGWWIFPLTMGACCLHAGHGVAFKGGSGEISRRMPGAAAEAPEARHREGRGAAERLRAGPDVQLGLQHLPPAPQDPGRPPGGQRAAGLQNGSPFSQLPARSVHHTCCLPACRSAASKLEYCSTCSRQSGACSLTVTYNIIDNIKQFFIVTVENPVS